jgi:acyl-CoA synthetase (NDP forming)
MDAAGQSHATPDAVQALLYPRSIAIVGASDDPVKLSGRPIDYLKRFGFTGRVLPINPTRERVQGLPAYGSLDEAGGEIDLAMIMLSADRSAEAVRECGRRGVRAAILGASGFAELGPAGAARQADLQAAIAETGVRVLGPNCLGMISVAEHATVTFTSALDEDVRLHDGPVAFLSQSGAFGGFVFDDAQQLGIGISHYLNTGNEIDLSVAELAAGLVETEPVRVLLAYLEGVSHGRQLLAAAARAHELDKPIITVKVGRSAAGAAAAASHTASLAGQDAAFDGVARQYGIVRVSGTESMLDAAQVFATGRRAAGRRLTSLSVSGGAGALMADAAATRGVEVGAWDQAWQARMAAAIPTYGSPRNPVDLTGSLIGEPEILRRGLRVAVEHPDTDMIAVLLGCADTGSEVLISAIEEAYRATERPLVVVWTGGSGRPRARLRELGIPCYADPGRAAAALGRLADYSLRSALPAPHRPADIDDETAATVLARARANGAGQLDEHTASRLIRAYGVPAAPAQPAETPRAAAQAAAELGGPVAVKVLSEQIGHKSDLDGVRLGLESPGTVATAAEELLAIAADAGTSGARVLVQRMAGGDVELIIGIEQDPAFGPVVVVGIGGVLVDVLSDSQVAAAPVDHATARRLLTSLRGQALFGAVRGRPACDLDAVAEVIVRLSWLACDHTGEIAELDINPLLVDAREGTVTAVDCLAVLDTKENP